MKFPKSPPVVRKMFQDQKKNIWVVSGETYEDKEDPGFENMVDVFSGKGEWLFSFKSKSISRNCLYHEFFQFLGAGAANDYRLTVLEMDLPSAFGPLNNFL